METTITISDLNAGVYIFTNTTGVYNTTTYVTTDVTLTN